MSLSLANMPAGILPEAILAQIPGYFLWKDLNSNYIAGSLHTAKLFGFKNADRLHGITDYDINCPAAKYAHLFVSQDEQLKSQNRTISVLDMHPYVDNEQKILLINKDFFYDCNGNPLGITCHANEIQHYVFEKMALRLFKHDRRFAGDKDAANYYLNSTYSGLALTTRQEQCFFYLLRGMTAKQTARILNISRRTVELHLDFVKAKLHVNNKSELVEKSLLHSYHQVIPQGILEKGLPELENI